MTIRTSIEIKQALIQIAEKLGRPHYELSVVREVIRAFQTGGDHLLKDAVLGGLPVVRKMIPKKPTATKKPKVAKKPKVDKSEILRLAYCGTITKFKSGCRCELCVEWA